MDDISPVFSVVLAHYQQAKYWKDAVRSVLEQDYPAIELIFSDDGTPAFRAEEVEQYVLRHKRSNLVRFRVLAHRKNRGTVRNLNAAHTVCTGSYRMNFAADDALFDSKVLSRFAQGLQNREGWGGVYGSALCCNESLKPEGTLFTDRDECLEANNLDARGQFERLLQQCFILMGAAAFRSEVFQRLLPYDEHYRLMEDWPFLLRMTKCGGTMRFLDFPALKYRAGGVSRQGGAAALSAQAAQCFYDHIRLLEYEILPETARLPYTVSHRIWRRYDGDRYYLDRVLKHYPTRGQLRVSGLDLRVLPERLAYYSYRHKRKCLIQLALLSGLVFGYRHHDRFVKNGQHLKD